MFSELRKDLVYTDISPDIVDHDEDMDGDLWNYDGVDVYRGSFDPRYTSLNIHAHWLYDDSSKRVGIAEHEMDAPEIYKVLWFRETPFGTLLQEDGWKSTNTTVWSMMSNEAYQDCLEDDFKHVADWALRSGVLLATPQTIAAYKNAQPANAGLRVLFVDYSFVMYEAPDTTRARQLLGACAERAPEQEPAQARPPSHTECPESPRPSEAH